MNQTNAPLLWERGLSWLVRKLGENRIPFFSALLSGLLAYTYAFTNKLPNHDELTCLFSKGATYESGRWGLEILEKILPNYSLPWLWGIVTLVLMAAAVCILLKVMHIQHPLLQGLAAGCILAFPSLSATFGYMFTASSYGVSFLLAVLAVWLIAEHPRKGLLPALGCMVFSLSIYQSYISLAAGALVLVLIRQLLTGEDALPVLRRGIFYLAFLVVSLVGYFAATFLVNTLRGAVFEEYATTGMQLSLSAIPTGILQAYTAFLRIFTQGLHGMLTTPYTRVVNLLTLGTALILLPLWLVWRKERSLPKLGLLTLLVVLLPLAMNCMYLIMAPESIHALVLYSFVLVYVFAAMVADLCLSLPCRSSRVLIHGLSLGLTLILAVNIFTANRVCLYMHLQYENTYAFYTGLAGDLKNTPDFREGTKIAIIGDYQKPEHFEEKFSDLARLPGVSALSPTAYSKARFLQYYLGLKLPFATEAEMNAISATAEFEAMAIYPYYGSTAMIGDCLVVKLS